jgi:hypothetical protein
VLKISRGEIRERSIFFRNEKNKKSKKFIPIFHKENSFRYSKKLLRLCK